LNIVWLMAILSDDLSKFWKSQLPPSDPVRVNMVTSSFRKLFYDCSSGFRSKQQKLARVFIGAVLISEE
jgi:hypothetical protein